MSQELGRRPSAPELYSRLHSSKGDQGSMVDKRAQDMRDAIAEKLAAASQPPTGEGASSSAADVDETWLFLDIESVNKKHWVYGLGSAISAYIDTAGSRAGPSTSRSQQPDDEVERRVEAAVEERLRQLNADFEARMAEERLRGEERVAEERLRVEERMAEERLRVEERMAELVRADVMKLMSTLPPEYRPPPGPSGDDDDPTTL